MNTLYILVFYILLIFRTSVSKGVGDYERDYTNLTRSDDCISLEVFFSFFNVSSEDLLRINKEMKKQNI